MNLQSLKVFLAVLEFGSLSAAARALYISQPAVSARIRELETAMGVRLLDRGPVGAVATSAGQVLARRAREIDQIADGLRTEVRHAQQQEDRRLLVGGTSTLGTYLLPRMLAQFAAEHHPVDVELRVGNSRQVMDWIRGDHIVLGLVAGETSGEGLACERILDEALEIVAPAGHHLAGRTLRPEELAPEWFVLREGGSSTRVQQEATLQRWGITPSNSWTVWGAEATIEVLRNGMGLALVSEHAVARELQAGTLVRLDVDPPAPRRPVTLVTRSSGKLTRVESQFIHFLASTHTWPLDH